MAITCSSRTCGASRSITALCPFPGTAIMITSAPFTAVAMSRLTDTGSSPSRTPLDTSGLPARSVSIPLEVGAQRQTSMSLLDTSAAKPRPTPPAPRIAAFTCSTLIEPPRRPPGTAAALFLFELGGDGEAECTRRDHRGCERRTVSVTYLRDELQHAVRVADVLDIGLDRIVAAIESRSQIDRAVTGHDGGDEPRRLARNEIDVPLALVLVIDTGKSVELRGDREIVVGCDIGGKLGRIRQIIAGLAADSGRIGREIRVGIVGGRRQLDSGNRPPHPGELHTRAAGVRAVRRDHEPVDILQQLDVLPFDVEDRHIQGHILLR